MPQENQNDQNNQESGNNGDNRGKSPFPEQAPQGCLGNFAGGWGLLIFVVLMFAVPWIFTFFTGLGQGNQISYSFFIEQLEDGNVESLIIKGNQIKGNFSSETQVPGTQGEGQGPSVKQFTTYYPSQVGINFIQNLKNQDVTVYTQQEQDGNFLTVLLNLLPFAIMIYLFYRLSKGMRSQGQGLFQIGKSKAKKYEKTKKEETTFADVAGIHSAKQEVGEIVNFLKNPEKYQDFGAKSPRGILLVGPPGTGKTLLARAVAGEADVPFYSISGSDFMEMFVGVGASRVRNLFKDAKKEQPSIIFIDEIDSIGRTRGAGLGGGHDEREQTLNQLLNELDGFEQDESTVVVAATNRPDILDPALLRPGRFDRQITTNLPPKKDRIEILRIHSRGKPLAESADLETLGANTPGFSGADLENLLNEAALIAVSKGNEDIENGDLDAARDKIILGRERKSVVMSDKEKTIVSYHETGHALVAAVLPNSEPVHKVTIIPREKSMGVTEQLPEEDKYLYEREYIEDRIAVMMGGRAAEQLKAETLTSGAENDLKEAQKLARKMVLDWGMSEDFEHIAMGSGQENVFLGQQIAQKKDYSEDTNRKIDLAVEKILQNAYKRARNVLEEKAEILDKIADTLREEEEVSGEEIYKALEEKS